MDESAKTETKSPAALRAEALAEWHKVKTTAERVALAKIHPVLREIFSAINFHEN